MQLVRLLLLIHVGVTAVLFLVLALVVVGQRLRSAVSERRTRPAPARAVLDLVPQPSVPPTGASVLEWTVDLSGVGQREAVLRT